MQVTLTARHGEGEPRTLRYRLHNMYARFNGGFGVQDEVAEVVAQLLLESAQEIAARLNRDLIQAPPHPSIASRLPLLTKISGSENAVRTIGLSGSPAAVPAFLALLAREADESARVNLIDALANLGSAEAVEPLAARYEREDEDCRFFILKAWDYIGGAAATELAAAKGSRDEDKAARQLAGRIGHP
jgi:HEAT repeat protein